MKTWKFSHAICVCLVTALLGSCAQGKPSRIVQDQDSEQVILTASDLRQRAASLKQEVAKDPTNAARNYAYGRVLLAMDQAHQALPHLEKAGSSTPDNTDYLFWLGVAYGENKMPARERASYEQALQHDRNHAQALIYLGNNYLNAKDYQPALDCYQRALTINPTDAQALYNRAIIFGHLHRTPEEKLAWQLYLESHPTGELARRAVDHLNMLEDFSYRNHSIGRIMPLPAISFKPFTAELTPQSQATLDQIGGMMNRLQKGRLDVLVYQKNNRELARTRAISIQKHLGDQFPSLKTENRIRLSWFEAPEKRKITSRTVKIDESIVFFLSDLANQGKASSQIKKVKK